MGSEMCIRDRMCVAAILAFSPLTLLRTRKFAQAQAEARYEELEAGLEEHDLHFGYASYWNAYKYSVLYDFDPEFAAVTLPDTQAFFWLTSSRLYQPDYCEGDTFLMFDEATEAPDGKMQERLARRFGEPKEIFSCAGYLFYVYDYNISERFISNVSLDHAGASQDLTVLMYFSEDGHANGVKDGVEELPQDIVHGPYISLQKGTYRLTLTLSSNADKIPIVVKSSLTNIIAQGEIDADGGAFVFELQEDMEKVEFVLSNSTGGQIDLVSITLQKIR